MRKGTTTPALAGSVMLLVAVATAPAHAVITPVVDPLATGTLALCIGEQPGATNYLYAEGPSYVPSTQTELMVPVGGSLDCRAYPVQPGKYYVTVYKYPKSPCTTDATRGTPPSNGTGSPQCYGKVHHIHVSHYSGVIDTVTPGGVANFDPPPAVTPVVHDTSNVSGNVAANSNVYGLEYTGLPPALFDDTVIEEQFVLVEVRAGETTQAAAHTTDHRTIDCWTGFDPDANGNPPVCN
jgi:hypothetical protein